MMEPGQTDLQVQQAGSMRQPKRWPLVTQPSNRSTSFTKDARLVNCYAEKHEEGYQVEKRFGLGPVAWTLAPGLGQGIFKFFGITALASNNNFYTVSLNHGVPILANLGLIV